MDTASNQTLNFRSGRSNSSAPLAVTLWYRSKLVFSFLKRLTLFYTGYLNKVIYTAMGRGGGQKSPLSNP